MNAPNQEEQEGLAPVDLVNENEAEASIAPEFADEDLEEATYYLDEFQPDRWYFRVPLILSGVIIATLLITARTLLPADAGLGTHQQLGLPECGFITMFGIPCPSCGMTTSWSYLTRGNLVGAVGANPGGTLLGFMAAFFAPWFIFSGAKGKWIFKIDLRILLAVVAVILTVTMGNWIYRIFLI